MYLLAATFFMVTTFNLLGASPLELPADESPAKVAPMLRSNPDDISSILVMDGLREELQHQEEEKEKAARRKREEAEKKRKREDEEDEHGKKAKNRNVEWAIDEYYWM